MVREKAQLEAAKGAAEDQAGSLTQEAQRFQARAQELEDLAAKLKRTVDEAKLQENRLSDRVVRLEVSWRQVQQASDQVVGVDDDDYDAEDDE